MKSLAILLLAGLLAVSACGMAGLPADSGWVNIGPTQQVKPNAYGLGVGMDRFGRPVRMTPGF
jgi:hypothetical protein